MTSDQTITQSGHDCVAEAIAQEIADNSPHSKRTDTYARIYQAAYLGAAKARNDLAAAHSGEGRGNGAAEVSAPWGQCKVAFFDDGQPDCDVERVWDAFGPGKDGKLPSGWEFCESGISGAAGFYLLFDVQGVPDPRDGATVRNALAELGFISPVPVPALSAPQGEVERLRGWLARLVLHIEAMRADEDFDACTNDAGAILFGDVCTEDLESARAALAQPEAGGEP